jgi:hypothetical protein
MPYFSPARKFKIGKISAVFPGANPVPNRIASVPNPGYLTWQGGNDTGLANWGLTTNWAGSDIPDGPGKKARFGNQIAVNNMVDMGSSGRTLGEISFTNGTSTTIESSCGYSLTLDNNGQPSTINVASSHTISAPVILNNDVILSGNGTLNLTVGISGPYTLTVTDGTLSASSIVVDTLTIGKSATLQAVPEPCTLLLLTSGLVSCYIVQRYRKK